LLINDFVLYNIKKKHSNRDIFSCLKEKIRQNLSKLFALNKLKKNINDLYKDLFLKHRIISKNLSENKFKVGNKGKNKTLVSFKLSKI
jgi:hypothetical protein